MLQVTSTAIKYLQNVALPRTIFFKTPAVWGRAQAAPEKTAISPPVQTKLSEVSLLNALTKEQENDFFYCYEYKTRIANSEPLRSCLQRLIPAAIEVATIQNGRSSGVSRECFREIEDVIKDRLIRAFGFHMSSDLDSKTTSGSLQEIQNFKGRFVNEGLSIPQYILEVEEVIKRSLILEGIYKDFDNRESLQSCFSTLVPAAISLAEIQIVNPKNAKLLFQDAERIIKDRLTKAFHLHISSSTDPRVSIKSLFKVQKLKKAFIKLNFPIPEYILEVERIIKHSALREVSHHQGIVSPSIYKPIFELQLKLFNIQTRNRQLNFTSSLTNPLFARK